MPEKIAAFDGDFKFLGKRFMRGGLVKAVSRKKGGALGCGLHRRPILLPLAASAVPDSSVVIPFNISRTLTRSTNGVQSAPRRDSILVAIRSSIALSLTPFRERGFPVQE